jgi:hypothetical protein
MAELMAEHIRMPGAPGLIVTRAQAYEFLIELGHPAVGGFGSVEYMVFRPRQTALAEPLSPADVRERVWAAMRAADAPRRWRIRTTEGAERLYWSNADGWVDPASADVFTAEEHDALRLPLGGEWEAV